MMVWVLDTYSTTITMLGLFNDVMLALVTKFKFFSKYWPGFGCREPKMAGFETGVEKLRAQGVESNLCARRIQSLQLQRIDLRTCIPELGRLF